MSLLDINFDGFSSAKLHQQILGLHVVIKKIYNFPEKFERPKFILPVKISWVLFFWGFLDGNENFAEIRAGSLSGLVALRFGLVLVVMPLTLVLQRESARKLDMMWSYAPTTTKSTIDDGDDAYVVAGGPLLFYF